MRISRAYEDGRVWLVAYETGFKTPDEDELPEMEFVNRTFTSYNNAYNFILENKNNYTKMHIITFDSFWDSFSKILKRDVE